MPINSGATGRGDDKFDDGDKREFAVENAILVLFSGEEGADEDAAILRSAYTLKQSEWKSDSDNNQITRYTTITTKVFTSNIPAGHNVYAYVILNKHDFFEVKQVTGQDYSSLWLGGTQNLETKTFGEIRALELDESNKDFNNQSFTMTNMPHLHTPGGKVDSAPIPRKPWILMKADKTKVYPTEAAALSGQPAVEIDVERVVAKVSVNVDSGLNNHINNDDTKPAFVLMGWIIDNTNPKASLSRNSKNPVEAADKGFDYLTYTSNLLASNNFRFVETTPVHQEIGSTNSAYRTYWAIDNNYNEDATNLISRAGQYLNTDIQKFNEQGQSVGGDLRPFTEQGSISNHYYCPENTFDAAHQTVKNTTRVIVAAKFNNGNSFVTLNAAPNDIYTIDLMKKYIVGEVAKRVNVQNWLKNYFSDLEADEVASLFTANVAEDTAHPGKATVTIALNEAKVTDLATAGQATSAITNWNTTLQNNQNLYVKDNIQDQLNYYRDGISYYQALIRHFNDQETPWQADTHMVGGNNVNNIYDLGDTANGGDKRYLGRYGVVRNNWYDLNITKISRIGSATVPELTDDPDDTVEQYVQVKINIMPWAMRKQDVIL